MRKTGEGGFFQGPAIGGGRSTFVATESAKPAKKKKTIKRRTKVGPREGGVVGWGEGLGAGSALRQFTQSQSPPLSRLIGGVQRTVFFFFFFFD